MKILVTGCAGFIGFHLATKLLKKKYEVFGIDNINNYYDIELKKYRINIFSKLSKFKLIKFYNLYLKILLLKILTNIIK